MFTLVSKYVKHSGKFYLDTNTASDTQLFGDGGDLVVGRHLNAQLAHTHHGAALLALLPASLRLAAIRIHNSDTRKFVGLLMVFISRHNCLPKKTKFSTNFSPQLIENIRKQPSDMWHRLRYNLNL